MQKHIICVMIVIYILLLLIFRVL